MIGLIYSLLLNLLITMLLILPRDSLHSTSRMDTTLVYHLRHQLHPMVPAEEDKIWQLQQVHKELKIMIQMAGEQTKINYDKKAKMPPTFHIGDKVFLCHDNISTNVPSIKLSSKFLEPLLVTSRISDVIYYLKLLKNLRIHDVFHVFLLKHCCPNTIVG